MIDREHRLSVAHQCELLALSRSTLYYRPVAAPPEELALMRRLDALHLAHPWMGSRCMRDQLIRAAIPISRDRVRRLMRKMGIHAIYRKPRTTIPEQGHKVYPYLLTKLVIERPNQVWAADVTYIPMARGFMYLVAVLDWHSRYVLSWELSNTLDSGFCVAAVEAALAWEQPEIFNTDQGSQFTSAAFTGTLEAAGVRISMDGRGRWLDNIFIERLWRSLKYEEVHLKAYADGREARAGISAWISFYNGKRPHQALGHRAPIAVWRAGVTGPLAGNAVDMTLRLDNAGALPTNSTAVLLGRVPVTNG
jgi:putative transposase